MRADEAVAAKKEEAAEQRMQEEDAARRLAILRGEEPPPLTRSPAPDEDGPAKASEGRGPQPAGRKRKRAGEDDTEFEMRVAREQRAAAAEPAAQKPSRPSTVALVDQAGHFDLFGGLREGQAAKNDEVEREKAAKKREDEAAYSLRFADAAGRGKSNRAGPWYAKMGESKVESDAPSTNVWGKDDPGRRKRDAARIDRGDPLALMKSGAKKARELERERREAREEREQELKALRREERRREKKRRRQRADSEDSLEAFCLDGPGDERRSDRGGGENRERRPDRTNGENHEQRKHRYDEESRHDRHGSTERDQDERRRRRRHRSRDHSRQGSQRGQPRPKID